MSNAYEFDLLFPPRDEIAESIRHLCHQEQSMKWLWVNYGIRCIYKRMVWGVQRGINGHRQATPEMAGKLFQGWPACRPEKVRAWWVSGKTLGSLKPPLAIRPKVYGKCSDEGHTLAPPTPWSGRGWRSIGCLKRVTLWPLTQR
jgi:hypothetical protein